MNDTPQVPLLPPGDKSRYVKVRKMKPEPTALPPVFLAETTLLPGENMKDAAYRMIIESNLSPELKAYYKRFIDEFFAGW